MRMNFGKKGTNLVQSDYECSVEVNSTFDRYLKVNNYEWEKIKKEVVLIEHSL